MACTECGNKEFNAHQKCRLDIVVDDQGDFLRNPNNDIVAAIYDSETPYGPFECTECRKEFDTLPAQTPE